MIMRGILRADSKERKVYAQMEAEMRAAQGTPEPKTPAAKTKTVANPPKSTPKTAQKVTKTTKK